MEGMKYLAREEAAGRGLERPLRWLSDFLREQSRAIEGEAEDEGMRGSKRLRE